jgi:hypothetical protein
VADRVILAAPQTVGWALLLVQPATVLGWHLQLSLGGVKTHPALGRPVDRAKAYTVEHE